MIAQHRLTRAQFERFFAKHGVQHIVMEACGTARHFARTLAARGFEVILLPAQYVRAYVRRNKTDSADAVALLERQLAAVASDSIACKLLMSIPGVGLLTATGMAAATSGSVAHFTDARHFASWFGLTPKEHSSGSTRTLGRIGKRSDKYLRLLLTHGARSVLRAAAASLAKGKEITGVRRWALDVQLRSNHNKATCALANKTARICFGVQRDQTPFGQPTTRLGKKVARQSFEIAV